MGEADENSRSLEYTPTWTVAAVATVFVFISFLLAGGIERLEKIRHKLKFLCRIESSRHLLLKGLQWLHKTKRHPLLEALNKMKEELMLLGFISLLLTVFQNYVASICIKSSLYNHWTPCKISDSTSESASSTSSGSETSGTKDRRLLQTSFMDDLPSQWFRQLTSLDKPKSCKEGYEPFVSTTGLHQLHTFIFVMAVVHVFYSLLTVVLALMRVRSWKKWELEAQEDSQHRLAEISKELTLKRQATFVTYHTSKAWSRNRLTVWLVCFFRQVGPAVTRCDYLTLRLGFINIHNTGPKFNFHSYMIRSMEDEFKSIVGLSAPLWALVVVFMLFNVYGVNLYNWVSIVTPLLLLVVGAKLHHIIATLALENASVKGSFEHVAAQLKPRDELFWFNRPRLLQSLLHFILFQNAFELAIFIWFWWQFTLKSCYLTNTAFIIVRLSSGFLVQSFCSYHTLPLYALVTQMGSHYKHAIFQTEIKEKLHNWHKKAKKRVKNGIVSEDDSSHDRSYSQGGPHNGLSATQTIVEEDFVLDVDEDSVHGVQHAATATGPPEKSFPSQAFPSQRQEILRSLSQVIQPIFPGDATQLISPRSYYRTVSTEPHVYDREDLYKSSLDSAVL